MQIRGDGFSYPHGDHNKLMYGASVEGPEASYDKHLRYLLRIFWSSMLFGEELHPEKLGYGWCSKIMAKQAHLVSTNSTLPIEIHQNETQRLVSCFVERDLTITKEHWTQHLLYKWKSHSGCFR